MFSRVKIFMARIDWAQVGLLSVFIRPGCKHQLTCYSGIFPVVATVIASSALLSVPIAPKSSFEPRFLFFGKVSMACLLNVTEN